MSANEVMTTSPTGAQKAENDERYDLIPVEPLRLLAHHYGVGSRKYAARNWELGIEWHKNFASAMRHMQQFWGGEDIDPETGTPHPISAAWHMFALAEYMNTHPELDDRPSVPQEYTLPEWLDTAIDAKTWIPSNNFSIIVGGENLAMDAIVTEPVPAVVDTLTEEHRPYKWLDGDGYVFTFNAARNEWSATDGGYTATYAAKGEPLGGNWKFNFTRVVETPSRNESVGGQILPETTTALHGSLWKRDHLWRIQFQDGTTEDDWYYLWTRGERGLGWYFRGENEGRVLHWAEENTRSGASLLSAASVFRRIT